MCDRMVSLLLNHSLQISHCTGSLTVCFLLICSINVRLQPKVWPQCSHIAFSIMPWLSRKCLYRSANSRILGQCVQWNRLCSRAQCAIKASFVSNFLHFRLIGQPCTFVSLHSSVLMSIDDLTFFLQLKIQFEINWKFDGNY